MALNCETYAAVILGCNVCEFFIICDAVCGQSRYKNTLIKVTFFQEPIRVQNVIMNGTMSSSGHLFESVDDLKEYRDCVVVYTRLCFE